MTSLLEVRDVVKSHVTSRNFLGRPKTHFDAVRGVSFDVDACQSLGIVGETGAGKSTVGRIVLGLVKADSGTVHFNGHDVGALRGEQAKGFRRDAAMIFQDPFGSFDPRVTVGDSVGEPLLIHRRLGRTERDHNVRELLDAVGMSPTHMSRFPHELSGGQLQRLAIARAISTDPKLIVCDEPVAALDMSVQAQIINLLLRLQRERSIAYIFISHDLAVVRYFADNVAVMSSGEFVETGPCEQAFDSPSHEYTKQLVNAIPVAKPRHANRTTIGDNNVGTVR